MARNRVSKVPAPTAKTSTRGVSEILCPAALVLLGLSVFCRVFSADFVMWDDDTYIIRNPHIGSPGYFWTHSYLDNYSPLGYSLLSMLARIGRTARGYSSSGLAATINPTGFHVVAVVIHICNALLLYFLLRKLVSSQWPALLGAMLFLCHPVQVESVSWAANIPRLASTAFGLVSLICYIKYLRPTASSNPHQHQSHRYAASIGALVAALLFKSSATSFCLMAFLLDYLVLRGNLRSALVSALPLIAVSVAMLVATAIIQTTAFHPNTGPFWARPLVACDAIVFYLGKLLVPLNLGIDYGRLPQHIYLLPYSRVEVLVVLALCALCVMLRKKSIVPLLAFLLFLAALGPVLGFVTFEFQQYSTVADRYLYIAMVGPAMGVALWLDALPKSAISVRRIQVAAAAVIVVYCALSYFQAAYWHNTRTLMQQALAVNPRSDVAFFNLGISDLLAGDYAGSSAVFRQAIKINPNSPQYHDVFGACLAASGDLRGAEDQFRAALACDPSFHAAQLHLSLAETQLASQHHSAGPLPPPALARERP